MFIYAYLVSLCTSNENCYEYNVCFKEPATHNHSTVSYRNKKFCACLQLFLSIVSLTIYVSEETKKKLPLLALFFIFLLMQMYLDGGPDSAAKYTSVHTHANCQTKLHELSRCIRSLQLLTVILSFLDTTYLFLRLIKSLDGFSFTKQHLTFKPAKAITHKIQQLFSSF